MQDYSDLLKQHSHSLDTLGLYQKMFVFDGVILQVKPQKSEILFSEQYEAEVFLAVSSPTNKYLMNPILTVSNTHYVDGRQVLCSDTMKVINGIGNIAISPRKTGRDTVFGKYEFLNGGKKYSLDFSVIYNVKP